MPDSKIVLLVISGIASGIGYYYFLFRKDVIRKFEEIQKISFYFGLVISSLVVAVFLVYFLVSWLLN